MRGFTIFVVVAMSICMVSSMTMQDKKKSEGATTETGTEVEEAKLRKELENLVKSLNNDQLNLLETILGKEDENDESTEFDMITAELKEMGMDEEDIEDLKHLAKMMHEFLKHIPKLAQKLEFKQEYDLLDNVQLYLLGLPNKLGPLGYIALHSVLEELEDAEDDGEIVNIKVEPATTTTTTTTPAPETTVPTFRKKRSSPLEQVLRFRRHA